MSTYLNVFLRLAQMSVIHLFTTNAPEINVALFKIP